MALNMATYSGVVGLGAVDDAARVAGACLLLFGSVGLGVTRMFLPDGLRRHEWLWVLPAGAVAVAFAMTPLGFLTIPFAVNLGIVWAGGLALTVVAVRRSGWPALSAGGDGPRALAWPAYLGLLLLAIALIPLFRSGFATVIGQGSDAHMAAGTAEFLRHNPPGAIDPSLPVDQMWLTWRSKHAIYYAFGAVATVAGVETWQALSVLCALLLTLAGTGMYVLAREVLGAAVGAATVALAIAGLSPMVIHTGIHPYFNQTWGYLTMPWSLVLAWWVLRHPSRGAFVLLGLFLAVGAFAYPLAVPIPVFALLVMWWFERGARRRRGERVTGWRDLWARFRAAPRKVRWGGYLLVFLLLRPIWGAYEKFEGAMQLLINPNYSLELWGGDLTDWFPEQRFFAIDLQAGWWLALVVVIGFALWELRRLPRPVAAGFVAVLLVGAAVAGTMRLRDYGWYFHFKMLAFVGPLVIVLAAVAIARLRSWGEPWVRTGATLLLIVWVAWAADGAREEVSTTFDELPRTTQELQAWSDRLPAGSSIRLDMQPGAQLWAAYMLHEHPLCSQAPLADTAYPHVQLSRRADYVLVRHLRRPFDAIGAPVLANLEYRLYRMRPEVPGPDRCSQRMVQTVTRIERG